VAGRERDVDDAIADPVAFTMDHGRIRRRAGRLALGSLNG
jgi:hypothetical protein